MTVRKVLYALLPLLAMTHSLALGVQEASLPLVTDVDAQPLRVHVERVVEALEFLGQPLSGEAQAGLDAAFAKEDRRAAIRAAQAVLDAQCLLAVQINPESRVKVSAGPALPQLVEQGWRCFLVKVHNQAGSTAALRAMSPQALPVPGSPASDVQDRWLELSMFEERPVTQTLSGLALEYRIIQLYSRDAGQRAAVLAFDVGQGTQDLGFRNDATLLFDCVSSTPVTLGVMDADGTPTTASFVIRDPLGRVYPSQSKRLAPDFWFHPQVYRSDGESLRLPAGKYTIEYGRGPEYLKQQRTVTIGEDPTTVSFELERWVDPSARGWWSGDHHIHAAGCAHYTDPSLGVHAPDMYRHMLGEDLKVGANLTWGPCFDYQKQFFTGEVDGVSTYPYLLRYDIEVSGFGSHQSGHLCLLRLQDQMYPGGVSTEHWPKLGLNTLRWAQAQGAVCGPAHSGFGLEISDDKIPSYEVPRFDNIGANEYIVDVTHEVPGPDGELVPAVDFMSTVDTPASWELNIWYHTLNCGFRTRISGETDFPCIYGDRVGMGRSYVKVDGELDYDSWCEGVALGRSYVSEGLGHLMEFSVGGVEVGTDESELHLAEPGLVSVSVLAAALLDEHRDPTLGDDPSKWGRRLPAWHLERARIAQTRRVAVEVIVNGEPVAVSEIVADGAEHEISFEIDIDRSSWVALRILHSAHTNPIFVLVGNQPIRASRRSAQWCLDSVEQCWSQKKRFYKEETQDAIEAYDHARRVYRQIIDECEIE